jgi:hypothetical protein
MHKECCVYLLESKRYRLFLILRLVDIILIDKEGIKAYGKQKKRF